MQTKSKYDVIVYIGRFQPVHLAHYEVIKRALQMAHEVIVIVGSAKQPRTYKNPFTAEERQSMLKSAIGTTSNMSLSQITDRPYNDQAWAIEIQENVSIRGITSDRKVAIIGHKKDESSFYLDMFPQWDFIDSGSIEPLNATDIRDLYFRKDANMRFIKHVVPPQVFSFLEKFKETEDYQQIIREREFILKYKKQYEHLPYAPTFVTADAVVIQSGHVLMIKRKAEPGKGLWALPGGFLDAKTDRSMESCAIRELKEETGIKVPVPVLTGSIKETKVFDAIDRSARGRTITHAFKIVLPDGPLPKVKGMDDAEKAKWIPVGELNSEECFEDHYSIITTFLGV